MNSLQWFRPNALGRLKFAEMKYSHWGGGTVGDENGQKPKPQLAVIGVAPAPEVLPPPPDLDAIGVELWREVVSQYVFDDPASTEILRLACLARQRAARCATQITSDGEMIRIGKSVRSHPLLRDEATFTALCAASWRDWAWISSRCAPRWASGSDWSC